MTGIQLSQRTLRAWGQIDDLPGDLRECVHEFGWPIVSTLLKFHICNPAHIREIVREIWGGARSIQQNSRIPDALEKIDWLLTQQCSPLNVRTLWRVIYQGNFTIVPIEPTRLMLDASMREVSGGNVRATKEEKHRLRYTAAVKAYAQHVNTQLRATA